MTALLVYKNETPEALAWAEDYKSRYEAKRTELWAWLDPFCDEHGGPPKDERSTYSYPDQPISGIAWNDPTNVPKGWRIAPWNSKQIVPHKATRIGKDAVKMLAALSGPYLGDEVERQLGMPRYAWVTEHHRRYSYGFHMESDGLWVCWGSRDVIGKIGDVESHGWVRVPLVEYIERFGEDAL